MNINLFHSEISKLLLLIGKNNFTEIVHHFNISKEIVEEIREIIIEYFGEWRDIKPIDFLKIDVTRKNKPTFEVFEMNELNHFGVECVLVDENEAETDLIFHAEFVKVGNHYKMIYKFIDS
jgi:hypothetical protein